MSELYRKLVELNKSDMVPLHMPGHKRNSDAGDMSKYYDIDITEIDGFDNLHDAEDIIKEAQQRANKLYGADETFFLVNGSTCGSLSAVSAVVPKGGKIIALRNSHKSFYHAAYINELNVEFVYPQKKTLFSGEDGFCVDIYGEVLPDDIRKKVRENPDAASIFITSPTYEGVPSDIREIAGIAHENNMILIVDAAHGAHFGMGENIPESAVSQGADIVIHSLHKTLASMTQTALLHVQGERVDREKLRRYLRIYQTSSPSYVLMSSMDSCIEDVERRGNEIFSRLVEYKRKIEKETQLCKHLFVPSTHLIEDPGKVLICSKDGCITGKQIYDILRIEYGIQLEMAGDSYGLAIVTGYDKDQNIDRLIDAINDIDKRIERENSGLCTEKADSNYLEDNDTDNRNSYSNCKEKNTPYFTGIVNHKNRVVVTYKEMEKVLPFAKAWDLESELLDITKVTGKVAADFINLYPPGIPFIIPGERFNKELVEQISDCINADMNIQGIEIGHNNERLIKVIKSSK